VKKGVVAPTPETSPKWLQRSREGAHVSAIGLYSGLAISALGADPEAADGSGEMCCGDF
jgi:hypothetical protein